MSGRHDQTRHLLAARKHTHGSAFAHMLVVPTLTEHTVYYAPYQTSTNRINVKQLIGWDEGCWFGDGFTHHRELATIYLVGNSWTAAKIVVTLSAGYRSHR